jgi:hypothetical protein
MNLLHNQVLQIYVLFLYTYGKTNESEKTVVFNETHLQKIFFRKLKNYEIMWKKRTDIGKMPRIRKKIKIGLYYGAKLF